MDLKGAVRGHLLKHVHFSLMGRSLVELQARMCPSVGARLRLLRAYLALVAGAFGRSPKTPRPRRIRIRAAGRDRDWWVGDPMEVAALWTVFIGGEYRDWLPAQPPRVIVDAGANVGSATLWFRERYPEAQIIAIEPNREAFDRLKRNVGDDPSVELVNAALSDVDGKASFAVAAATSLQGQLQNHDGGGAEGVVEVDALTVGTVRDRHAAGAPIDLLKLNVEGAEWPVLSGSLQGIGTIAMEIHEPVPGNRDPDDVLREVAEREGFVLRQGYSRTLAPRNLRWLVRSEAPDRELQPFPAPSSSRP